MKIKDYLLLEEVTSALDWTNELSKKSHVTLIHRRKDHLVSPDSVNKMLEIENEGKVNFLTGSLKILKIVIITS